MPPKLSPGRTLHVSHRFSTRGGRPARLGLEADPLTATARPEVLLK